MKSILNRIAIALLITSLASVAAFAKTNKAKVTFDEDIKVNGTLVKKGVYDVRFDDKTGELSTEKGKTVVARVAANVEKRDKKAARLQLRTIGRGDDTQLTGVTFSGSDENLILSGSQASR